MSIKPDIKPISESVCVFKCQVYWNKVILSQSIHLPPFSLRISLCSFKNIFSCVYVHAHACVHARVYTHEDQKKVSGLLELDLQVFTNHLLWVQRTKLKSSGRVFLTTDPSFQPLAISISTLPESLFKLSAVVEEILGICLQPYILQQVFSGS